MNHGVDAVTIGSCSRQRLQDDDGGAFAANVPVAGGVAELAAAVGRHHAALRVGDRDVRLKNDVRTASEGNLRVTVTYGSRGEMYRCE